MTKQSTTNQQVFGYQLLLDLYDCKPGVCDDLGLCYQFLDDMVADLGMEKQTPPNIFRSDETRFPDKAGLSGWVPLIESSIVIHTLSLKNFITIDIYCCRCFDREKAKEVCRAFFSPQKIDEQYIERGCDYFKEDSSYHTVMVDKSDKNSPQVTVSQK
ncbi:MAG: S-adenosylmethionine decarboxylase [Candidatus Omnitrophica bacterium]|nr:S-adenosylmethionine decarboxylase [Candidatus Omnitrophota bacterium]MCB9747238.1 S-adenosylmethionine decarboxylase [Candidatus Omnitrophota bacterium]